MEYTAAVAEGWEEFGRRVYAQSEWEGIGGADEVVVIGDGARWVWELAGQHFPGAVQILDFYHASGHLWEAAWVTGTVSFVEHFGYGPAKPPFISMVRRRRFIPFASHWSRRGVAPIRAHRVHHPPGSAGPDQPASKQEPEPVEDSVPDMGRGARAGTAGSRKMGEGAVGW